MVATVGILLGPFRPPVPNFPQRARWDRGRRNGRCEKSFSALDEPASPEPGRIAGRISRDSAASGQHQPGELSVVRHPDQAVVRGGGGQALRARLDHLQARRMGCDRAGQGVSDCQGLARAEGQEAQLFEIGQRIGLAALQVGTRHDGRHMVREPELIRRRKDMAVVQRGADRDAQPRLGQGDHRSRGPGDGRASAAAGHRFWRRFR